MLLNQFKLDTPLLNNTPIVVRVELEITDAGTLFLTCK